MTGEITLRVRYCPSAASRRSCSRPIGGGIKQVLIPAENEKDLVEIPDNIKGKLDIRTVKWDRRGAAVRPGAPADPVAGGSWRGRCRRHQGRRRSGQACRRARKGVRMIRQH